MVMLSKGVTARVFFMVMMGFIVAGCANVIRPNYTQELTELRSGEYTLDPEHAYVHFQIDHLGLSKIVGRFNRVSAELDFDADHITSLSLQGFIEAASIDVNNKDLEATLTGRGWLDAGTFPQIVFSSTAVQTEDNGELLIDGELTMKGITQAVQLKARFNGGADNILTGKYTIGFAATTSIVRSDYGIDGFAALVGDRINIDLHGEFQRN